MWRDLAFEQNADSQPPNGVPYEGLRMSRRSRVRIDDEEIRRGEPRI